MASLPLQVYRTAAWAAWAASLALVASPALASARLGKISQDNSRARLALIFKYKYMNNNSLKICIAADDNKIRTAMRAVQPQEAQIFAKSS